MQTLPRQRLTLDDLIEAWDSSEQDIHINAHGVACYCGRSIAPADENGNPDFVAIKQWCDRNCYWPNVWETNGRGNIELFDLDGNSLGGLV